jgi:ABC-type nitrate/sulfonate/bicarbonate transport system substrate-binding protein
MKRTKFGTLLAAGSVSATLLGSKRGMAQSQGVARLALGVSNYGRLPYFIAIDQGLFAREHVDLVVTKFLGAASLQMARMARGEIDMMVTSLSPGIFNQILQGFDVKVIASALSSHAGWNSTTWLVVRQDLWDSKAIRSPRDLKGHTIDGAVAGTPPDYMAKTLITQAGLKDVVVVTEKFKSSPEWFAALRNKAVDVQAVTEPTATELESQGLAHKWLPMREVLPNYQETYLVVNTPFLREHRDVVKGVLVAYLRAAKTVNASNGKWTQSLAATAASWTEIPLDIVMKVPGPGYVGDFGFVDVPVVQKGLDFWVAQGLVPRTMPVADIIDTSVLRDARREAGIR